MKRILISLFLILSLFLSKPIFAGEDITITCNPGSECTKSSELPIFNEQNIYPGQTFSQNFYVDNNRDSVCNLTLKGSSNSLSDILPQKILVSIIGTNNSNSLNISNYLLSNLLDPSQPNLSLGHVNKDKKNSYQWSVIFDSSADNNYQNLTSNFDINFNFECDEETGDVLSSISNNPPSNQGTAQCTNQAPDAPTGFYATRNPTGSVTLHWDNTPSNHTGYLIAFGTSPSVYQYGAPDVGNVESYTVQGLTYGAQYCFYVRSLNGCMPGGRTPEYCVNPGAVITPANVVPTGFQPNVLGDTIENNSIEEPNGNILGTENDNNCTNHWLPILFIGAFLINLIYISFSKRYILFPFLISLVAFIFDKYILNSRCCLGPNWLCSYFWIGNILSWLVPISIKIKFKKD